MKSLLAFHRYSAFAKTTDKCTISQLIQCQTKKHNLQAMIFYFVPAIWSSSKVIRIILSVCIEVECKNKAQCLFQSIARLLYNSFHSFSVLEWGLSKIHLFFFFFFKSQPLVTSVCCGKWNRHCNVFFWILHFFRVCASTNCLSAKCTFFSQFHSLMPAFTCHFQDSWLSVCLCSCLRFVVTFWVHYSWSCTFFFFCVMQVLH